MLNPLTITEGQFIDLVYQRVKENIHYKSDDINRLSFYYEMYYAEQYENNSNSCGMSKNNYKERCLINYKRSWNYAQIEQTDPTKHLVAWEEFDHGDVTFFKTANITNLFKEERRKLRVELGFETENGIPTAILN